MNTKSYILLANREKKFLKTVCQSLLDAGYPVLTATTMSSALNLLSNNTVSLIICDSELEDFSGYDFLRFLKSSPLLRKIPFVFFESIHNRGNAGKAFDMGAADFIVYTLEEEVSKVLEAFDMGAANFIVYTPEEEITKVLIERIGKMLPSMAGNERISASPKEASQESFVQQIYAVSSAPQERRDSDRIFFKQFENIELSRDAVLWFPGQIINISELGLMVKTSLLGKLGMLLYIRVLLPDGKYVIESRIKHISISNNQLSAEIGVKVETSTEWSEIYHYIANLNDSVAKPPVKRSSVVDKIPEEKIIDATMIMRTDDNKMQHVDLDPLSHNLNDSRSARALEIKFYRSLIGKQLGNYKAVSFIGAGSMGGVFKGWDVVLERNVALKIISYNLSTIASYRDMFFQEARLVSRLIHPNIAQIYHIDEMDDVLYFAMEFISGGTLANIIEDRDNINTTKGLEHLITTCRTLDFVSRQNIVHRDIKPANIMIDDLGILKVLDFGVAIVNDGTDEKRSSEGLGSPLYVSPECITGQQLDSRSDIYSLGATFYNVFAGVPPFDGDSVESILSKHLNEDLIPLKKKNPILSSDLSYIIGKMMAKNPKERYQNYQTIIDDLTGLMH
jgi:CheY-like chemotaxis protein/tRNA A-37 threonylcarbamoyl transferase component Bud32